MKRKNGFTLIELLAIILILAIIAVITVPIILNIIDNAERNSVVDSAYGYKDALQKYYTTKLVQNPEQELPSGYLDITELPSDFTVSGENPSDGWVKLKKGIVEEYSLKYNDYVVTKYFDKNVKATKRDSLASIVRIPDEYQEVEYLESTGKQYIDTEFKPNNNTRVDIKFMALDSNPSGAVPLFGTRSSNAKKSYTTFYKTSNIGSGRTDFGDQFGGTSVINFQPNTIYSYIKNKEKNYLNDINISNNDVYEFQTDYPLYLYDINSAGVSYGTNNNRFFGNIYYTKIYDNDALVRNFVPVIRKSDNKPGLLDLANLSNNLFDENIVENGYHLTVSTGIPSTYNNRIATTTPINVSNLNNVTVTYNKNVSSSVMFMYSLFKNGTLLERVTAKQSGDVIDVSNADELYIAWYLTSGNSTLTIDNVTDIMLNEGSTALPYEPYKKSFYTNDGTGEFIAGPEI